MLASSRFAQPGSKNVRNGERYVPSPIAATEVTLQHSRDSLDRSPGGPGDHVMVQVPLASPGFPGPGCERGGGGRGEGVIGR